MPSNNFIPTDGSPVAVLNAVTTTGVSSIILQPTSSVAGGPILITWQTSTTGSPTGVSCTLQGSLDGVNWATIDTTTSTSGELRFVTNSPVVYIRLNLGTFSGGTVPTFTGLVMITGV